MWDSTLHFGSIFTSFACKMSKCLVKILKKVPNQWYDITFLWLFIRLFLSNFVYFDACLRLIPLFPRYMNMYPRVLYTKSNLSLCLFNMWNMSLIWPEMPEIWGMWKNKWSSGHPVDDKIFVESLLSMGDRRCRFERLWLDKNFII